MNKGSGFISKLKWISFISKRFSRVDRKGRSAVNATLATLGIGFGVMTLIVVMSIMNGFQMTFIDSILEISSYHVRAQKFASAEEEVLFSNFCDENKNITSCTPFYEAQTLMTGEGDREMPAIIRAIDPGVYYSDEGFNKEVKIRSGLFNLEQENSIVLGNTLARKLGLRIGDNVNLFVLSGGDDVSLFSSDRIFTVTGTFSCGYSEINEGYAFISLKDGMKYFGENAEKIYGIKLKNSSDDLQVISRLENQFPHAEFSSWRDYNKSFFGTLKIEKNMLLLLVALIFVVVGINIFNGMRRLVFERRSEIAVLSAIGASGFDIKLIFILRGLRSGLLGSLMGLVLGLLISVNTQYVFNGAAAVMYGFQYFFTALFTPENLDFIQENSTYSLYASIPARVFFSETVMITVFGIISPLLASLAASRNVLKSQVAEVLHYE